MSSLSVDTIVDNNVLGVAAVHEPGWKAYLHLDFQLRSNETWLAFRRHHGPLRVQRPFYPETDGTCHVYLLHPPGGVVGGDQLDIQCRVAEGARSLVTTPAAGKFYRSAGPLARQAQRFSVSAGAMLEWLPQENIVFSGARVDMTTRVELEAGAGFCGWEITCLGRPAAGEKFDHGCYRSRFEIWRDETPLFIERARLRGGDAVLEASWGMGNYTVVGTLVCVNADPQLVDVVRNALPEEDVDEMLVASQTSDVLVARYLGHSTERARIQLTRVWDVARQYIHNKSACRPRVWDT
jgi:urease accessory protein